MFVRNIRRDLEVRRIAAGLAVERFLDLIFADDVTIWAIADELAISSRLDCFSSEAMERTMEGHHLSLATAEYRNILLCPPVLP